MNDSHNMAPPHHPYRPQVVGEPISGKDYIDKYWDRQLTDWFAAINTLLCFAAGNKVQGVKNVYTGKRNRLKGARNLRPTVMKPPQNLWPQMLRRDEYSW